MSIIIDGIESYKGLVVSKYEASDIMDSYDSNYFAIVWDWSKMRHERICYGSTRSKVGQCTVDASAIVLEAYNICLKMEQWDYNLKMAQYDTEIPAKMPIGAIMHVTRGRTIKGQVVTIRKLYHNDPYNRCLVTAQNGTVHEVYIKNMDVLAVPLTFYNYSPRPEYSPAILALFSSKSA